MPQRKDINSILVIGAGPIVIGQACEFDYSGTQACEVLKALGYKIILVNSNPATIMTDPEYAHATYIEPIQWEVVERIIEREKPDAILPTMGGQTALNCALDLEKHGVLKKYNVELIGATPEAIEKAEDREKFRKVIQKLGYHMPLSGTAETMEAALELLDTVGFPAIIRPSFTMGGSGGGIAYNREEFIEICQRGFDLSPTHQVLIDESILGWKEYELEVVRDKNDNCIIICSIENLDPMGVHTGDSITVAPAQTLTDKEYQVMRTAAFDILREIGVDTGGANVQFGVNPKNGKLVIIEMNPRVSRSSALASKATGFPIARIAAKLAVGFTLDECQNEMTGGLTPASFEPSIDYVVVKIPRFTFEKFPTTPPLLGTQMQSVGEVMALGQNFQQALQKAIRSLEGDKFGLEPIVDLTQPEINILLTQQARMPTDKRLFYIADGFRYGFTVEEIFEMSQIDPWFLENIYNLIQSEKEIIINGLGGLTKNNLLNYKQKGFADKYIARLLGLSEKIFRQKRLDLGVQASYKKVDTCAAEFPVKTNYFYSSYYANSEIDFSKNNNKKIMILGGGPNRIGQGIELDYCCVHGTMALREMGYETIMVNCNPETVSTDYHISDKLFFEGINLEDILNIIDAEQPLGVIIQWGGQTPLKLANDLESAGVKILGTSPQSIDQAEDRELFKKIIDDLGLKQPLNATVRNLQEALGSSKQIGFPLLVRPSFVLGGRAMEIVYDTKQLENYIQTAVTVSHDRPVLLDKFLDDAIEVDVDGVCDGKEVFVGGIMEHIERAGIHSGDSSCTLPPHSLSSVMQEKLKQQFTQLALKLDVVGLVNAQFAIQGDEIFIIEVNPRASRTVPFVSKATGVPLAKIAARCILGESLKQQNCPSQPQPHYFSVKQPVFPFIKFKNVDSLLGPEMKSTGEVMGVGKSFGEAYSKGLLGANINIKKSGLAFISVKNADKARIGDIAQKLIQLGFNLIATSGTKAVLDACDIPCEKINKVSEGRPHIVDKIKNGEIDFIVNTTEGNKAVHDSFTIRHSALQHNVSYTTTLSGARAVTHAMKNGSRSVACLQDSY